MANNINFLKYYKLWLGVSATIILIAIGSIAGYGLNYGIDFTGGSSLEIRGEIITPVTAQTVLGESGLEGKVQTLGESLIIRTSILEPAQHEALLAQLMLADATIQEYSFESIGPSIGLELKNSAIKAVIILLALIALYIAWAFRNVGEQPSAWKYGIVTMIAAAHDVLIPLGAFSLLGHYIGYQVDTAFVAALLTILGYSINDTIVVLDRTRENIFKGRHSQEPFISLVNRSLNETLARSLNTTLIACLPLLAVFIFGGESTKPFVLALLIGILSGAYSSVFIASPLLVWWQKGGARAKH